MPIEYEAKFYPTEIEDIRSRLTTAGAKCIRPEYDQKRFVFDLAGSTPERRSFVRVRDEGNRITMTLKHFTGKNIDNQHELEITVSDFPTAVDILKNIGLTPAAYEESRRELWNLDDTDVTIDSWPFLGTVVEIEGKGEDAVKAVTQKLDFEWNNAKFGPIGNIYVEKYGLGPADLAKKTGKMTDLRFDVENPFV